MKNKYLSALLIFLGLISIGTLVNYLCIPLYVSWGMLYPVVLTETIQNKLLLSLIICEVPWLFLMMGMFIISLIGMLGVYIWIVKN